MQEKHLGRLQLVLVIAFVLTAVIISRVLDATRSAPGKAEGDERKTFVTAQTVAPEPYRIRFQTSGVVQAKARIAVVPQVSGRIVDVADQFYDGGRFEPEQVLFRVEPRDYEVALKAAEAELASARTQLELEQARAQSALRDWRSSHGDQPAPPLVLREPQLQQARAALQAAEARAENARINLQRTEYRLPFPGRVLQSDIAEGQFVTAGQPYGQVFNSNRLEVRSSLNDRQLSWLLAETELDISIHANFLGRSRTFAGKLNRSVALLDQGTRFAPVLFEIDEERADLLPGVFAEVTVEGPRVTDTTRIPASAIQKGGMIWQIKDDMTLTALQPQIVLHQDNDVIVRGIDSPIRIVTSRLAGGVEGMHVQLSESADTRSGEQ